MNNQAHRPRLAICLPLFCLCLLGGLATAQAPVEEAARKAERFVLTGSESASLYNLPDPKGHIVLKALASTPLLVHGSKAEGRYLKVSAPGGLKVWVFGKYLTPSQRIGWVELTGSYVNMRPLPRSQNSYPLGQLERGDRLRLIQRFDPTKPLAEDWVQVWSPADAAAYVLASQTTALRTAGAAEQQSKKTAGDAEARAGQTAGDAASSDPATTSDPEGAAAPGDVFAAMRRADALVDAEMTSNRPNYLALRTAFDEVLALGPDAPTIKLIERRLNEIALAEELASLKMLARHEEAARAAELQDLQTRIAQLSNERDPLWGRFSARGWLEAQASGGQTTYIIRFGSEIMAEVRCQSGRYDLAQFTDCEIGVRGLALENAAAGGLPAIDIDRIEILSARQAR